MLVTTPAHASGVVDVKITDKDGQTATLTNGYTYVEPVNIPDENLLRAINRELGRGDVTTPVYSDEMSNFYSLEAPYPDDANKITDLTGLELATNLSTLNLSGHNISNLSPLSDLTNLYGVYLSHNQISDLSPLADLTSLEKLFVDHNQITDFTPLQSIASLRHVFGDQPLVIYDLLKGLPNYNVPEGQVYFQSIDEDGRLLDGVYTVEGQSCTRWGDPDWSCQSLSDFPQLIDSDVNSNHDFYSMNIPTHWWIFGQIGSSKTYHQHFYLTETTTPEGYYPDPTPKVAYAGCGGWFTIPGDDGSDPQAAYEALTSCDQVDMLPDSTLTWVKKAIPKATVEPITSSPTQAPTLTITNDAVNTVIYNLVIKNSSGQIVNSGQPEMTLAAGEALDLNLASFSLPAGSYTYQLMSTDNTDQPIEVVSGKFTIQAEPKTPTTPPTTAPETTTHNQQPQAPATGFSAQIHPALIIISSIMVLAGAGLTVRSRSSQQ